MKKFATAAALAALLAAQSAQAADDGKGSLYLQCDGKPNNVTDGETFARLLGAITLLGLFAPSPEAPDPSKRQFGDAGVDACSQLIDGEKSEGNAVRRIPLILARALHRIEAKNYDAALVDVDKARGEAAAAGLVGNPYFDRSMGLSFSEIEAAARLRMGDAQGARDASLAPIASMTYSFVPNVVTGDYGDFVHDFSPAAEHKAAAGAKVSPGLLNSYAARLEEVGRFADAASKREALIAVSDQFKSEDKSSAPYARAALSHALAGDWDRASERAAFARENLAKRRAAGKPEDDASEVVEVLDLYDIAKRAHDGDLAAARRNFAARSQWLAPSLGAVMEMNRRLREGANEAELFGSLETTPEALWQKRYDEDLAVKLQGDTDNKTLFNLIQPYAKINEFESRSKDTWRVEKSKMMGKKQADSGFWVITAFGSPYTSIDSILLHAALQARTKGNEGFTIIMSLPKPYKGYVLPAAGYTRFVNRGDPLAPDEVFIPASDVITELSPVIPSPDELKARKAKR